MAAGRSTYGSAIAVVAGSTLLAMLAYAGPLGNVVTLSRALRSSPGGSTWILASMSMGLAVTLLAAGVIADDIGRRRVFGLGAVLFVAANAACALADSTLVFVIARIAAGVAATGMIATGLGLAAAVSENARHRAATATAWSVAMGAGIAGGPLLTGLLDRVHAWRGFYWLLALGGLAIWAGCRWLPAQIVPVRGAGDRLAPRRRFDLVGFALLTALLTAAVTAIVEVRVGRSATAIVLGIVTVVLLGAFVVSQWVGSARLVEPRLFGDRRFVGATVAGFATGIGVVATMSFACTFMVAGLGLSTLQAGAMLASWSATSAVAALLFSRRAARLTGTTQLVVGLVGVAVGLALLTDMSAGSSAVALLPGMLVAGVASGLLNTGLAREAVASVPADNVAMGTGANNTARYLGSSIGVSVASVIAGHGAAAAGWDRDAWLGAAASVICAALVAGLALTPPRRRSRDRRSRRHAPVARA